MFLVCSLCVLLCRSLCYLMCVCHILIKITYLLTCLLSVQGRKLREDVKQKLQSYYSRRILRFTFDTVTAQLCDSGRGAVSCLRHEKSHRENEDNSACEVCLWFIGLR